MTVRATWNGAVLAVSDETIVVEGNEYFPRKDVASEFLESSSSSTFCPWKGHASYFNVVVEGERNDDAAWYYPDPLAAATDIKNYVAFWKGVEVEGRNENSPEIRPPSR